MKLGLHDRIGELLFGGRDILPMGFVLRSMWIWALARLLDRPSADAAEYRGSRAGSTVPLKTPNSLRISYRLSTVGFSLVELVIVIGIIAILIAILMPALTLMRERANQVKCMSNLRSIAQAGESHLAEHDGYLPTCGWQWYPVGGVVNPTGLADGGKRRYDYYRDDDQLRPLPITAALAQYLGVKVHTDSRQGLEADLQGEPIRRLFSCPSQTQRLSGWTQRDSGGWTSPDETSSYVFNEAVLGRRNRDGNAYPFPDGLITKVKRTSEVFLAADGRTRDPQNDRCFLVFDFGSHDTMADFETNIQQSTLGKELVDHFRHRRKMNVVFLDNHVETVPTDLAGLRGVGVSRGIN